MRPHVLVVLIAAVARCGRGHSAPSAAPANASNAPNAAMTAAAASATVGGKPAGAAGAGAQAPARFVDVAPDELWKRAAEGDADDLARLATREGAAGLMEQATPATRLTALRALAYAEGQAAFSFLAAAALDDDETEASAALEALGDIAARPRRATDPEDAMELREGCDNLLALARDTRRARKRRVGAVRVLRMMIDRGCAKAADVPTDVDAQ